MKQRLKLFGIYGLFWLVFFLFARLLFLLYEYPFSFEISIKEWLLTFIYGIRLDISTTGYILTVTGLIFTFTSFSNGKLIYKILKGFTIVILSICAIIIVADLELYKSWGYRMDGTPLLYLAKPKEAMASTETWLAIVLFLVTSGLIYITIRLYNRIFREKVLEIRKSNILTLAILLLLTGCMIVPVRASFGIAPVNTGMVYFSNNKFSNHAAVNVVWNVMNSLAYRKNTEKTYNFMEDAVAEKITQSLHSQSSNNIKLLYSDKPNIVILILESFSSKVIGVLDGKWDATPQFNSLAEEGLLFTNFYSNASRSDKGIISILSGYPGQPTTSIIKTPEKTQSLPSLAKSFNNSDYETYFYYGGDIDFANMRSYFLNSETKHIISVDDFDPQFNDSKWGVHDEHLFERLYNDIVNEKEPFFKTVFTLSSHDPFEVPIKPKFEGNDRATKYLNSVYYTDSCLGEFFNKIRETEAWNNTLFILVADHGSNRPGNSQNHDVDKFEIPMLWLGGVLTDSIKTCDIIGSQIDIPSTLLGQVNKNSSEFTFSKDLFSERYSEFAFYVFNDGFGFITDTTKVIYDNVSNDIILKEGLLEQDLLKGKAYLQYLMNDFKNR
ncbi:MAG: sulfatase-like hydrolase/transferase [Bacteroidales bacterium]|nr:sulfatase-like hydrolase/transferase [Bacteroidales bacterium]